MSITVRLWNEKELSDIKTGKDRFLATVFMNRKTFSAQEINAYPYNLRRTFVCEWNDEPESITIYATDKKMLKRFLELEYTRLPDFISEQITKSKDITL